MAANNHQPPLVNLIDNDYTTLHPCSRNEWFSTLRAQLNLPQRDVTILEQKGYTTYLTMEFMQHRFKELGLTSNTCCRIQQAILLVQKRHKRMKLQEHHVTEAREITRALEPYFNDAINAFSNRQEHQQYLAFIDFANRFNIPDNDKYFLMSTYGLTNPKDLDEREFKHYFLSDLERFELLLITEPTQVKLINLIACVHSTNQLSWDTVTPEILDQFTRQ